MGCRAVPLAYRLLYGFLAREGCRCSEALLADVGNYDLERGTFRLDENKTDEPRPWMLNPGVVEALRLWAKHPARPKSRNVFVEDDGKIISANHLVDKFRSHLEVAGIDRPELFMKTRLRSPIRTISARRSSPSPSPVARPRPGLATGPVTPRVLC